MQMIFHFAWLFVYILNIGVLQLFFNAAATASAIFFAPFAVG